MTRITWILMTGLMAALVAACSQGTDANGSDAAAQTGASQADAAYLEIVSFDAETGGVVIGNPDAALELVEYASLTCGHCKDFHEDVLPRIKRDYVATGQLRLVFQEFPTPPIEIALAGFATARCTGESGYMAVLDDFFATQEEIFTSARAGTVGDTLIALAERHGIKEADFEACILNQDYRRAVSASVNHGQSNGINSTPSLILNGEKLDTTASRTPDGLAAIIDAALAPGDDADTSTEPSSTEP